MKKKLLSVLLSAAMVATMLTACGGGSTETEAPAEDTTAEETTETEPTAEEETETETASTTDSLVYWSMWTSEEPQAKVIQEAADAYEASTGIKINIEWKGRDIATLIQAALEQGTEIDLFDDDFQRVSATYKDYTMDLEDMAAAAGYESTANAGLTNAVRGWAGSLKAIPYQPYTSGIFYNTAMFEAAGITAEPQTWDELLDACQKLKDAGYEPMALDDAYVLYNMGFHLARHMGQDAVKDLAVNGGWSENEAALTAAQELIDFVNAGYLESGAPGAYPASENKIGFETTAMVVNASWVPAEITNNTQCDLTWGMFNYPSVTDGTDPNTIANVGAQAFAIPSYSENGQAAFDFIMTLVTGEYDQKMADETTSIPADSTNTWPSTLECCKGAYESLTDVYEWNMGLNDNSDLTSMFKDTVLKLFEGQYATAEDFCAAMDALY